MKYFDRVLFSNMEPFDVTKVNLAKLIVIKK